MKIALLNDTHCGVRNSSQIFIDFQERFYNEIFFPFCKDNDIKHIIHLGDYYDHRKFVNFKALNANRRHFLEPMKNAGMTMDIIPGNHDVFHKNTNELCSLKELLGYYTSNINIIMKPSTLNYDGCDVHLVPWINPENWDMSMNFLASNKGIVMAHLELANFEMMRGIKQLSGMGMSKEPFKHFDMVLSGHYHASSQQENIRYLGCQMEFTWADAHDEKYFHILDTDTKEIEAIPNPLRIFEKIYYDDTTQDYNNFDINICTDKFVKVIVGNKSNPFMFDKFIERISELNTHDLKIAENFSEFLGENVLTNIEDIENTTDLMASYIDGVNTDLDKGKLKTLMNSLYNDALDMEIQ
jgi:DNA repair exonuclease SbcCD nuclease subunit